MGSVCYPSLLSTESLVWPSKTYILKIWPTCSKGWPPLIYVGQRCPTSCPRGFYCPPSLFQMPARLDLNIVNTMYCAIMNQNKELLSHLHFLCNIIPSSLFDQNVCPLVQKFGQPQSRGKINTP